MSGCIQSSPGLHVACRPQVGQACSRPVDRPSEFPPCASSSSAAGHRASPHEVLVRIAAPNSTPFLPPPSLRGRKSFWHCSRRLPSLMQCWARVPSPCWWRYHLQIAAPRGLNKNYQGPSCYPMPLLSQALKIQERDRSRFSHLTCFEAVSPLLYPSFLPHPCAGNSNLFLCHILPPLKNIHSMAKMSICGRSLVTVIQTGFPLCQRKDRIWNLR